MAERPDLPGQNHLVKLDWNTFQLICERLAETGAKIKSCQDLGFAYATVQSAIASATARDDSEWRDLWDHSYATFQETIEQEAIQRAILGREKEVYGRVGKDRDGVVGKETVRSDALLNTLLKGHIERYKDRAPILAGSGLDIPDIFAQLTPEARKRVRDIIVEDLAGQAGRTKARKIEARDMLIEGPPS